MPDVKSFPYNLLDAAAEGLMVLDGRESVVFANEAARRRLGVARDAQVGAMTTYAPEFNQNLDGALLTLRGADGVARVARLRLGARQTDGTRTVALSDAEASTPMAGVTELFDAAPVGVALLSGPDHVFTYVNQRYRADMGRRDFVGRRLVDALPEVVAHGRIALFDAVYRYGQRRVLHERVLQLNDAEGDAVGAIYTICYEPVRDARKRITGIMVIALDVTDAVLARDLLGSGGGILRQVIDASPAIVWSTDDRGRRTYISRKWFEITGHHATDEGEVPFFEHIHPDDVARARVEFDRAVEDRLVLRVDYRVIGRGTQIRRVINVGYPRYDRRGRYLGHVGTIVEATEGVQMLVPKLTSGER